MREILMDWNTARGGPGLAVFYFSDAGPVAPQRQAIKTFVNQMDAYISGTTTWTVRQEGRILEAATGAVTGLWSDPVDQSGDGAGGDFGLADATQLLIRWKTTTVVDGRVVQGRTFIPGILQQYSANGNVAPSLIPLTTAAALGLVIADVGFGIWHRPKAGAGGVLCPVTSAGTWSEFAVLRRRRS